MSGCQNSRNGIQPAAVVRRERAPHDLDVLLRHRLLPQPGGFEGRVVVPEELDLADFAVANGIDGRQVHIRLRSVPLGVPDPPGDNPVGGVTEVAGGLDRVGVSKVSRIRW